MGNIFDCVKAYQDLMKYEYYMVIGKNKKKMEIHLRFDKKECFHLMGLQHLKDLPYLNKSRDVIFDKILAHKITQSDVRKSVFYDTVSKRIDAFPLLERLIDNNNIIFKYNRNANAYSLIPADILLKCKDNNQNIFLFISENKDNADNYYGCSFFPEGKKDYSYRQPLWTLLYKEKINLDTNDITIQYNKLYDMDIVVSPEEFKFLKQQLGDKVDILSQTGNDITLRSFKVDRNNINKLLTDYRENQIEDKSVSVQKIQLNTIVPTAGGTAVLKAPTALMTPPPSLNGFLKDIKNVWNKLKTTVGNLFEQPKPTTHKSKSNAPKRKSATEHKQSTANKETPRKQKPTDIKATSKTTEKTSPSLSEQPAKTAFHVSRGTMNRNADKIKQERNTEKRKTRTKSKNNIEL